MLIKFQSSCSFAPIVYPFYLHLLLVCESFMSSFVIRFKSQSLQNIYQYVCVCTDIKMHTAPSGLEAVLVSGNITVCTGVGGAAA